MKLIYVVAAVAMLAMLIPAMAIPAAAADGLVMTLDGAEEATPDGYNVAGSIVTVTATGTVTNWWIEEVQDDPESGAAQFVDPIDPNHPTVKQGAVKVQGTGGEYKIWATIGSVNYSVGKKWGDITDTEISPNQSKYLTWNETLKRYEGSATIMDTIYADFWYGTPATFHAHVAQGAIVNWYLVPGSAVVDMTAAHASVVKARILALGVPFFTQFGTYAAPIGTTTTTISDKDGESEVSIFATGPETVQVVAIAEYPDQNPQKDVFPEVSVVTFKIKQLEVVPQVRWVGEKIVLEKNFGYNYIGNHVQFTLENQSVGTLEAVGTADQGKATGQQSVVDTTVDGNGLASCILKSSAQGEAKVELAVYDNDDLLIENEHSFTVYYLQFAGVILGNVQGKRAGHNSGLWTPPNPWDPTGSFNGAVSPAIPDETTDVLGHNVSADTLLRARVRGYFTNSVRNPARMTPEAVDTDGDGEADLIIPEYAWVLPDDWSNPKLMGAGAKTHWDIMDNPFDDIVAVDDPQGPYGVASWNIPQWTTYAVDTPDIVAAYPVVGPFSPGIELMTPMGWAVPNPRPDGKREYQTVVPNGTKEITNSSTYIDFLDPLTTRTIKMSWDCPMPPAKITYVILDKAKTITVGTNGVEVSNIDVGRSGFFKPADKTDIYYLWVTNPMHLEAPPVKVYTNPFYFIMVPAHEYIVAFGNNEHYDWATFGSLDPLRTAQGPYPFWSFINVDEDAEVYTSNTQYPTIASVYSDNHGEAMVWLNGDWNLNLDYWSNKEGVNVPVGQQVGSTTVQVIADYPYARGLPGYLSNTIEKNWMWGSVILGASNSHPFADGTATIVADTRMILTAGDYHITGGTRPYQNGTSQDKVVWIWACDRDGKATGVADAKVSWSVDHGVYILDTNGFISGYNDITENVLLVDGFLAGTNGTPAHEVGGVHRTSGVSSMISPRYDHAYILEVPATRPDGQAFTAEQADLWKSLTAEEALFYKFFNKSLAPDGLQPDDFVVAALDLFSEDTTADCTVSIQIRSAEFAPEGSATGLLKYSSNVYFNPADPEGSYPLDDAVKPGDANMDNQVNMGDVTVIEKMILGLKAPNVQADVNCNSTVDMGDVVRLERTLLGLK